MTSENDLLQQALFNARRSYQAGDHHQVRFWAQKAAQLAPDREDAWLWLAAVSSPRASIDYLKRALEISPTSQRARKGMHWAINRFRESATAPLPVAKISHTGPASSVTLSVSQPVTTQRGLQFTSFQWVLIVMILGLLLVAISMRPIQFFTNMPPAYAQSLPVLISAVQKASDTPLPSDTPTVIPSPTSFPTETPISTPTETSTPLPTETSNPLPTNTQEAEDPLPESMPDVGKHERWVDVDLTKQQAYAYEGTDRLRTFIVSTGTYLHPTVTGQYRIYAMYESAPMWGPDYYLPGVPYTMYFYEGYALHGTYWHDNFGTPMSHGCVNLKTDDAEWLFYWSSIGTLVNIHY